MIVLDTHVWIWWLTGDSALSADFRSALQAAGDDLAVSAISVWEVAKLVERGRLRFSIPVEDWIAAALRPPIQLRQH